MKASAGTAKPMGARLLEGGVNFALYSRNASSVRLVLFNRKDDEYPTTEIELNPPINRSGDIWHIFAEGLNKGQFYGWRVDGPRTTERHHCFNPRLTLLDPYARAVTDLQGTPKCVVIEDDFDWQGVPKPNIPWKDTVIYETHVRGLTAHPSSGVKHPGTFLGVIEKIPHLKDLGITAVEFMPLQEFNHHENLRLNPLTGEAVGNYWGYSSAAFFAPNGRYSSSGDCGEQVGEFREMVRQLHLAGIEVILDMVFNHTAESGNQGSVYSFKGIDNSSYYLLERDSCRYMNLTGCGNTFFCNNPPVSDFIIDCLRYWVSEMGVDGFRFDLATIFNRDQNGDWWEDPPILQRINDDPVLRNVKLISEPWDAAGGHRMGRFGGSNWGDWNDRFRDDVRRFWRGDKDSVGDFASRLAGSEDYFGSKGSPLRSVNYVTCHDGFTLNDLVSYRKKHNLANGHGGQDGASENLSSNFGVEGETGDLKITAKRIRQVKNFLATLFLSQGVPMLLGGDEFQRTQQGNNNPYCQDNEISWYNWDFVEKHREIYRFCRELIRFRKNHPALRRSKFFTDGKLNKSRTPDIGWLSENGEPQDWKAENRRLACFINGNRDDTGSNMDEADLYFMFNSTSTKCVFKISPLLHGKRWRIAIDTGAESPGDIFPTGEEPLVNDTGRYRLKPLSTAVLIAKHD